MHRLARAPGLVEVQAWQRSRLLGQAWQRSRLGRAPGSVEVEAWQRFRF